MKLTLMLDASALGEASCLYRLFNNVVQGYAPKKENNDLEFGSAMHKFAKVFRDKGIAGIPQALNEALTYYTTKPMKIKKEYLTPDFLSKACMLYAQHYANDNFEPIFYKGEPLTELRFCQPIPFYEDDLLEILMAGTTDELGKFRYRSHAIKDLKVTSLWDRKKFFESYQLSSQLRFYRWNLREFAEFYPDSIYAEIQKDDSIVSFIDAVFHKPGLKGQLAEVEMERSPEIVYHNWELDEFEEMLKDLVLGRFVPLVKKYMKDGTIPTRDGILVRACQTVYGDCKYAEACKCPDMVSRQLTFENNFIKREYDPLSHGE